MKEECTLTYIIFVLKLITKKKVMTDASKVKIRGYVKEPKQRQKVLDQTGNRCGFRKKYFITKSGGARSGGYRVGLMVVRLLV